MTRTIDYHVDQVVAGLEALEALMMQPESYQLASTHHAMERLHAALPLLSNANIAFAFVCERDGAGRLVGANHPVEYLTKQLGLPRADAFNLLSQAKTMFGEVEVPTPPSDPSTGEEERRKQQEEEKRRKEEARKAKERARKAAAKANAEKKRIIDRALMQLNEHADPGRDEVYARALEAAETMSAEELRKFVTNLVKRANRKGRDYSGKKDPLAAFKKRTLVFGEEDSDGGTWAKIYLDKASRAALEAAIAAGEAPGANLPDGVEDKRTRGQRRFDQLMDIVNRHGTSSAAGRRGLGTVVLTMTLDELLGADAYTEFATNTSVSLTALDVVRLGLAGDSFALQLDSCTGVPLSLGRARLASIEQKMVLLAMQQVCAWTGCTKPGVELEAHHIEAYFHGGLTNLDNLILLCREHHRCNNDNRDGAGGKGHFEKDPATWDITHHPADGGPPVSTSTHQYQQSPGQRTIRRAQEKYPAFDDPPNARASDPPLFEVGENRKTAPKRKGNTA
ncbi:HNH endonuclease signature motif containing protein [Corynebacterium fournieri]|uniref:HNH endonuclease signature motif containing protein n=1 Tax=Corynebacterium fournieri TaxID=1852390 RepID=UPI001E512A26|nr:HNH endonuclease signature motif containing protein [Corynebacterium fournieri]WJY98412.1 hypothetical protein CFOUR_10145 [Corynebacterium fournieri]